MYKFFFCDRLEFQNFQNNPNNTISSHDDFDSTNDTEYMKSEFSFVEQSNSLEGLTNDSSHIYQDDDGIIEVVDNSLEDNDSQTMVETEEPTQLRNHFEFIENEPSAGQSREQFVEIEPPPKKLIKISEKPKRTKYKRIAPKAHPTGYCMMPSTDTFQDRLYKINSIGNATAMAGTSTFIVLPKNAQAGTTSLNNSVTLEPTGKNESNQHDVNGLQERLLNICDKFSDEEFGYGMHIAQQLRSFPTREREIIRNKINNLVFNSKISLLSAANASREQ